MPHQQRSRMKKLNAVTLAKRIHSKHSKRICSACGACVTIYIDTGSPFTFKFIKNTSQGLPWVEISLIEFPYTCNNEDISSFTTDHKRRLLLE